MGRAILKQPAMIHMDKHFTRIVDKESRCAVFVCEFHKDAAPMRRSVARRHAKQDYGYF